MYALDTRCFSALHRLADNGDTMHAFMAVGVDRPEAGLQYNARSAKRAWTALETFLEECFAP